MKNISVNPYREYKNSTTWICTQQCTFREYRQVLISHCSVTSRFKNDREGYDSKVSTQTLEIIQPKYSDIYYVFSKCRYRRKSSYYQLASDIKFQIVSMDTTWKRNRAGSSSPLCPISSSKSYQWTPHEKGIEPVQALHYVRYQIPNRINGHHMKKE